MKGNKELIEAMNSLLVETMAAQNQNMVHTELCESWGYKKLQMAFRLQIINQMHESEWLIERIIFLGGTPRIAEQNTVIMLGKTVTEMIGFDKDDKRAIVKFYNQAIVLARKAMDQGSVDLLTRILRLKEHQVGWEETQHSQINQMGLENYLSNQTGDIVN